MGDTQNDGPTKARGGYASRMTRTAVLGAGSWGTALAKLVADQGHPVSLWSRRREQADAINETRHNPNYLTDAELPESLLATDDLEMALKDAEFVIVAVPTPVNRELLTRALPFIPETAAVLSATKGIEMGTLDLVSQIFEEVFPKERHGQLTYLGGPSFAFEVAQEVPTAVCVAGHDEATRTRVAEHLTTGRFRVYLTDDVIGVEVGGALKNVVAIAAGIADGMKLGHNTRAALITRGLAELGRLAAKLGSDPRTMGGLGGMGDLVLTCTGDLSRNRQVGIALGQGKTLSQILDELGMVAEGVKTAKSAHELGLREGVEMPITDHVYRILYEELPPREALVNLMTRPMRDERG